MGVVEATCDKAIDLVARLHCYVRWKKEASVHVYRACFVVTLGCGD